MHGAQPDNEYGCTLPQNGRWWDMLRLYFDRGPIQNPFTENDIRDVVGWIPRRMKLATEWKDVLKAPRGDGENWSLVLPFRETFENAFRTMCAGVNHYAHVGKGERCIIFLNDSQSDESCVEKAKAWITSIEDHIVIRDCLSISFALDYRTKGGDPQGPKTAIGELCRKAKPYDADGKYDRVAARQLAQNCVDFLEKVTCYDSADCVVAMPPSRPDKPFDLPRYLAGKIASALGKDDLRGAVVTKKARGQLKATNVEDKLKQIEGTVHIDAETFNGKSVLIVDDLYQSGTSVNYLGLLLLEAGAKKVFSIACEKTVGNFDNLGTRGGL